MFFPPRFCFSLNVRSKGGCQRTFRLKTWRKWRSSELNLNAVAYGHLDDTTGAVRRHLVLFCWLFFFYIWRIGYHLLQLYWIWLQRVLPPETPTVAKWCVDNEWILSFGWTVPLSCPLVIGSIKSNSYSRSEKGPNIVQFIAARLPPHLLLCSYPLGVGSFFVTLHADSVELHHALCQRDKTQDVSKCLQECTKQQEHSQV